MTSEPIGLISRTGTTFGLFSISFILNLFSKEGHNNKSGCRILVLIRASKYLLGNKDRCTDSTVAEGSIGEAVYALKNHLPCPIVDER